MKYKTFRGGIHPPTYKETRAVKIQELAAPKKMVFPLSQHIGAPAEAVVAVGDEVKVGQLIAKASSFVSANIHSSVSGVVTAIEPVYVASGLKVTGIIIENDDKYELSPSVKPCENPDALTPQEIAERIREAGIVGMGGATFPTHVKLSPPADKPIDTVLINGAECEPFLTSDHRVMLECPEEVIRGCRLIMKAVGAARGIIAVEDNKPDAIDTLRSYIDGEGITVMPLQAKYPQGSEKQLINAVTGREVPSGGLPSDVGVVVNNIDTATAVARAIDTGMPLIRRVVTVSGSGFGVKKNFRVRIGTPVSDIVDAVGGFLAQPKRLLMGGPMMGQAIFRLDVPIVKGSGALLALTEKEIPDQPESVCLRCGKCVEQCPMRLQPLYLNMYAQLGDFDRLEKLHILDCMECGACTYLCPGRQSPVQNIRVAKQKVLQRRNERKDKER